MPTIVFATPKGGAGKSTSAVLLASEFANRRSEQARVAVGQAARQAA
jgi:cellulose biosynthesis protein BcsQ